MQKNDLIKILETAGSAPADPYAVFRDWFTEAERTEPSDPNAMCLATCTPEGRPSARIVLMKAVDERGFVFFTNRESRKGSELAANPLAALCFHWKTLSRQVRIEGRVSPAADTESDSYYATRGRGSRLGAWASRQSRPLESRTALARAVQEQDKRFAGLDDIPRPPHWGGYRLTPDYFEFWHDGAHRLHTRLTYRRDGDGWTRQMLYP